MIFNRGSWTALLAKIRRMMWRGKIPGLCLVIVREGKEDILLGFGYADRRTKTPVTSETLFELASCSKSFTALAVLQLVEKELICLNSKVSSFLPWFSSTYNGRQYDITIKQLLNHTSGIPWQTISLIPERDDKDALMETVKTISRFPLAGPPGQVFEYATVNYDILGAVIEVVTGETFENYMRDHVFKPLGLVDTFTGVKEGNERMAVGYKTGLFLPVPFKSPLFRGNNPAAYVISNGKDISRWLKIQLGMQQTPLASLIKKSHQPVKMPRYSRWLAVQYNMGWITRKNSDSLFHPGSNPNFFAYMGLDLGRKTGFAVLVNSNSPKAQNIARYLMAYFSGWRSYRKQFTYFFFDRYSAVVSFLLAIYLAFILDKFLSVGLGILQGLRRYRPLPDEHLALLGLVVTVSLGLSVIILTTPWRSRGLTWKTVFLWASRSLPVAMILLILSLFFSNALLVFHLLFPL